MKDKIFGVFPLISIILFVSGVSFSNHANSGYYITYCIPRPPACTTTHNSGTTTTHCTNRPDYCMNQWITDSNWNPVPGQDYPTPPPNAPTPPNLGDTGLSPTQIEEVLVTGNKIEAAALTSDDIDWHANYTYYLEMSNLGALQGALEAERRGLEGLARDNMIVDHQKAMCAASVNTARGKCKGFYYQRQGQLNAECNGFASGATASLELNFKIVSAQVGVSGTEMAAICRSEVSDDTTTAQQFCETDTIMFSQYAGCPQ